MPCDGVVRIPNSHPEVRSPTRLACRQRVTPDLSPFLRRGFRRRLKELSTDSSRVTDPPETSLIQKRDPRHHGSPRWALSPRDDILFELLNATRVPSSWQYAPTAPTAHHARKKNPSCYWLLISYLLILLTASFFLAKGKKRSLWSTFSGVFNNMHSFVMLSLSCHLLQGKQPSLLSLP